MNVNFFIRFINKIIEISNYQYRFSITLHNPSNIIKILKCGYLSISNNWMVPKHTTTWQIFIGLFIHINIQSPSSQHL